MTRESRTPTPLGGKRAAKRFVRSNAFIFTVTTLVVVLMWTFFPKDEVPSRGEDPRAFPTRTMISLLALHPAEGGLTRGELIPAARRIDDAWGEAAWSPEDRLSGFRVCVGGEVRCTLILGPLTKAKYACTELEVGAVAPGQLQEADLSPALAAPAIGGLPGATLLVLDPESALRAAPPPLEEAVDPKVARWAKQQGLVFLALAPRDVDGDGAAEWLAAARPAAEPEGPAQALVLDVIGDAVKPLLSHSGVSRILDGADLTGDGRTELLVESVSDNIITLEIHALEGGRYTLAFSTLLFGC